MSHIVAVMLGGGLGAAARYLLAGQVMRWTDGLFPWGTLAVNIAGALLMGILVEVMALRWTVSGELRAFLTVGLLGGFTTFSAFSLEMAAMIERHAYGPALAYALSSVVLCLLSVFAGMLTMRALLT